MTGMVNHGTVVFLAGADTAFHLEKHHSISTVGHRLIAPQTHNAWTFQGIVRMPVGYAGGLLHQGKRSALFEAAHQVVAKGGFFCNSVIGRVVVPGDKIHIFRPHLVIQRLIGSHQVGGDRNVGRDGMNRVIFQTEGIKNTLRVKTFIIQRDSLEIRAIVMAEMLGTHVRNNDLIEIVESMSPESGIPGCVDCFDGLIFVFEPLTKSILTVLTIAFAAVFVGDVPGYDIVVGFIAFGQF